MSYKIPNMSDVVMYYLYRAELLENAAIKGDYCLSKLDKSIKPLEIELSFDLDVDKSHVLNQLNKCGEEMVSAGVITSYTLRPFNKQQCGKLQLFKGNQVHFMDVCFDLQDLEFGVQESLIPLELEIGDVKILILKLTVERILAEKIRDLKELKLSRDVMNLYSINSILKYHNILYSLMKASLDNLGVDFDDISTRVYGSQDGGAHPVFDPDDKAKHLWVKLTSGNSGSSAEALPYVLNRYFDFLYGYKNYTSSFTDKMWDPSRQVWQ